MKDGVILINTARAQIVAEEPFLDALRTGKIAMAGLDVFWEEPLPHDHPLMTLQNVVMTPHIGYATQEAMTIRYRQMVETLAQFRRGNIIGRYPATEAPSP
jgi:D-3-phosphoglycerate dehydrogenase